eukprot:symbB.v1.2.012593.t1/scaffold871.1/size156202/6
MGGFPGYVSSYHFLNASNRVWPASFAGKCPRRGAPVDAAGHGLWSEDDGYDGYDGDAEDAEDGEEMQVEEVEVPSNATPETEVEPEELPEPLASCIREDGSAPAVHAAFYLWQLG